MSHRVSFWGGLSLSLLMLGGCLLADVGINPALEQEGRMNQPSPGAGAGGSSNSGSSGSGGGSGPESMPAGGSGGSGGGEGASPGMGGATGAGMGGSAGAAGTGDMPTDSPGAAGSDGALVPGAEEPCPDTTDREVACSNYCALYTEVCQDFEAGGLRPYDYAGSVDCFSFCMDESNGWVVGTITSGNTIMCRCAHAFLSLTQGRNPHCFHSARQPTAMCL